MASTKVAKKLEISHSKMIEILERMCTGITLGEALGDDPKFRYRFYELLQDTPEYANIYMRVKGLQTELEVDEMKILSDDRSLDPQRARNMIDVRKWKASKILPSKYGDRLDVNVNQTIDIGAALVEARQRALSIADQSNVIETQRVDIIKQLECNKSDDESVTPPKSGDADDILLDDIFK